MSTHNAVKFSEAIILVGIKTITLSGTVKKSGVGVSRKLLIYKNTNTDIITQTQSESDGTFSVDVDGGSNDEFRVIAVGLTGENSDIYEHIAEG